MYNEWNPLIMAEKLRSRSKHRMSASSNDSITLKTRTRLKSNHHQIDGPEVFQGGLKRAYTSARPISASAKSVKFFKSCNSDQLVTTKVMHYQVQKQDILQPINYEPISTVTPVRIPSDLEREIIMNNAIEAVESVLIESQFWVDLAAQDDSEEHSSNSTTMNDLGNCHNLVNLIKSGDTRRSLEYRFSSTRQMETEMQTDISSQHSFDADSPNDDNGDSDVNSDTDDDDMSGYLADDEFSPSSSSESMFNANESTISDHTATRNDTDNPNRIGFIKKINIKSDTVINSSRLEKKNPEKLNQPYSSNSSDNDAEPSVPPNPSPGPNTTRPVHQNTSGINNTANKNTKPGRILSRRKK